MGVGVRKGRNWYDSISQMVKTGASGSGVKRWR